MPKTKRTQRLSDQEQLGNGKTSTECASCGEMIEKELGVTCSSCHAIRHMKKKCAGLSKMAFEKDNRLIKNYVCEQCKKISDSESGSDEESDSEDDGPRSNELKMVLSHLTRLETRMEKRLNQFQAVVEMCSMQIDDITELKSKVSKIHERLKKLESAPKLAESKHREVIISNVPPMEGENTTKLAMHIFEGMESGLEPTAVQTASRFESSRDGETRFFMKVLMANDEAKGKVIKAARAAKSNLKDLNLVQKTGSNFVNVLTLRADFLSAPIFVNEAVSRSTKALLTAAIKLKREKNLHTVWTYLDKVYVRKQKDAKPRVIDSEEDLIQLKQE